MNEHRGLPRPFLVPRRRGRRVRLNARPWWRVALPAAERVLTIRGGEPRLLERALRVLLW